MRHKAAVATALTLTVLVGAINPAHADLRISEFEGHIVFCAAQNPPVSVEDLPGGRQIVTFVNIGNVWLTGNPLVDGVEENRAAVTSVPDSLVARVNIMGKVDVAAVDGHWRFRQHLTIRPNGFTGIGLGLGFGDLHGKLLLFQAGTPEPIENSPCGVPIGAPVRGKVVSFGSIT